MELLDKELCCGCGACANACPKDCITMKQDEEGFYYPYVDEEFCISCGKCQKACPILNNEAEKHFEQVGYLVQHNNEKILAESTSGGAFTAIAEWVIEKGGVVFGATFADNWEVMHVAVEKSYELGQLRNSKYVQSRIDDAYRKVVDFLAQGRYVCFSGTPCQVEGLLTFLGKKYEKLITVDIVCHSTPSPGVWKKYIDFLCENIQGKVKTVKFREKLYGYKYSVLTLRDAEDRIQYAEGIDTDPYMRAFFSDMSVRPSCYSCQFKKRYRKSDFTIWDCFNTYDFSKKMDDNRGATRVLIHTEKGKNIFDEIKGEIQYLEVDSDRLVFNVREMTQSVHRNSKRAAFFEDYRSIGIKELFQKYYPQTWKTKLEKWVRITCARTGIYGVAIRVYKGLFKGERRKR